MRGSAKYHNTKIHNEDGDFDSTLEWRRYKLLKAMAEQGEIAELQRQVPFELVPAQRLDVPRLKKARRGKKPKRQLSEKAVTYYADFTYIRDGKLVVEDTKSEATKTADYIIKRKLMKFIHDIEIQEVE